MIIYTECNDFDRERDKLNQHDTMSQDSDSVDSEKRKELKLYKGQVFMLLRLLKARQAKDLVSIKVNFNLKLYFTCSWKRTAEN